MFYKFITLRYIYNIYGWARIKNRYLIQEIIYLSYENKFRTKDMLLFKSDSIILQLFVEHFIHFQISQLGIYHEDTMY